MEGNGFFIQALVYLLAAVISVPIAKRLGFGSVLGYLIAGIIIGPFVLGFIGQEGEDVMHFAEFGVVMMLFLIGLELKPSLLWKMKRSIFGLGGLQVALSALIIGIIAFVLGQNLNQSLTIGLILALSSTAIVVQSLAEKGYLSKEGGRYSFSVLLFQDIVFIPILALLPLLAVESASQAVQQGQSGPVDLAAWLQVLLILGIGAAIVVLGRFLARHIFRIIANTGLREIFTATALLLIISIAVAMKQVGLSPALGAFLAGVVLADNEYRHELETDIEPFKGLLLGLFFISVGASIDFGLLFERPWMILGLLLLLIGTKFIILLALAKAFRLRSGQDMLFSFALAQGGEFAFVLIAFSRQNNILTPEVSGIILITVALSMAITPLLLIINEKLIQPRYTGPKQEAAHDEIQESDSPVVIAGFGRFGVVLGRLLIANGIRPTILDDTPSNIQILRKFGFKVYYGDASRPDLLESAGLKTAKVLVLSIDDRDKALQIAEMVQRKYPHVRILARTRDIRHKFEFLKRNVETCIPEVYGSAVELGIKTLQSLGFTRYQAHRAARTFKHHDVEVIQELYKLYGGDEKTYIQESRRYARQLERLLLAEHEHPLHEFDEAWDISSRREEIREMAALEKKKDGDPE